MLINTIENHRVVTWWWVERDSNVWLMMLLGKKYTRSTASTLSSLTDRGRCLKSGVRKIAASLKTLEIENVFILDNKYSNELPLLGKYLFSFLCLWYVVPFLFEWKWFTAPLLCVSNPYSFCFSGNSANIRATGFTHMWNPNSMIFDRPK